VSGECRVPSADFREWHQLPIFGRSARRSLPRLLLGESCEWQLRWPVDNGFRFCCRNADISKLVANANFSHTVSFTHTLGFQPFFQLEVGECLQTLSIVCCRCRCLAEADSRSSAFCYNRLCGFNKENGWFVCTK